MKAQEYLLKHDREFLTFLKTRVPVFHLSNIFFRDVHYAAMAFLEKEHIKVRYTEAEALTQSLIQKFVQEKVLGPVDYQTWVVQYPEFRTPVRKQAAPPAAPAKASPAAPPRTVGVIAAAS
jgi:hypothetical protein